MSQQGGPPAGFNPNSVGAINTTPDPNKSILGLLNDGPGLSQYDTRGFLGGNIGGTIFSPKDTGWKSKLESGLGIRTKAKFEGFEGVESNPVDTSSDGGNATYEQVFGAAQTIMVHGGELRGLSPHEDLGEHIAPPTPGMGGRGRGGVGM